jgi:hypothetical protein
MKKEGVGEEEEGWRETLVFPFSEKTRRSDE